MRNVLRLPVILGVRIPLMISCVLLARIGEWADSAGQWVNFHIPGWRRD